MKPAIIRPPEEGSHAVFMWQLRESLWVSQAACVPIGWGRAWLMAWCLAEELQKGSGSRERPGGQGREKAWGGVEGRVYDSEQQPTQGGELVTSAACQLRGGRVVSHTPPGVRRLFFFLKERNTSYSPVASYMIHLVKWISLHNLHSWTWIRVVVCTCVCVNRACRQLGIWFVSLSCKWKGCWKVQEWEGLGEGW